MAGPVGEWCSGAGRPRCERRRAPPQAFRRDATATGLGIGGVSTCGRHGHCEAVFWGTVRRSRRAQGLGALRARADQAMRMGGQGQRQRPRGGTRGRRQAPVCVREAERPRPASSGGPRAGVARPRTDKLAPASATRADEPRPGPTGPRRTSPLEPWPTPMGYTRNAGSGTPGGGRYAFAHRCAWERVGVDGRSEGTGLHNSGRRRCRSTPAVPGAASRSRPAPRGRGHRIRAAAGGPRTRHRGYNEAVRSRAARRELMGWNPFRTPVRPGLRTPPSNAGHLFGHP